MLKSLFDEHANPTHTSRRDVHDQLAAIVSLGAKVQKQMIEYRACLMEEQLSQADPALEAKYEQIHQTIDAAEREARIHVESGRQLAKTYSQIDRVMAATQLDVANIARAAALKGAKA